MAGSLKHLYDPNWEPSDDPTDSSGGWSLIENMGDAYECVEELLYLILAHLDNNEMHMAIEQFYRYERGELDPKKEAEEGRDDAIAYLKVKEIMER